MARLVNSHKLPLVSIDQGAEIPHHINPRCLLANTTSPNGNGGICLHIGMF